MNFQHTLTIPAETTAINPTRERIRLTAGMVSSIYPIVPSGCYGLVGVRILRGNFQLWPMTEGEWFVADGFADVFSVTFPLEAAPYELVIEGYNIDDTYAHSISFRIGIDRQGDPGLALIDLITERIPPDLDQFVVSTIGSEGHAERMVSIMRKELMPVLEASLVAQRGLLRRTYDGMDFNELFDF